MLIGFASCNETDTLNDNAHQSEIADSLKNETSKNNDNTLTTENQSNKDLTNLSEETKERADQTNTAFVTENISRIIFYGYHDYGLGKGSEVPKEYMDEIINWLETFTVGKKVPELVPPGTNSVHIEIVYSDGIIFESGMDTVMVNGSTYYIERDKAPPECYYEILSHTK